jgi:cytochrome b561
VTRTKNSPPGAAIRSLAGDDRTRYDPVAMSLHWATVFLVLANFLLAETWESFARPTRHAMIAAHMSFGILLASAVLARIVWRQIPNRQTPPALEGLIGLVSRAVHGLLYGLLVVQATLGFLLRWSGGEAMSFFGLQIPPPFARWSKPAHNLTGEMHDLIGWTIIIVALGHAGMALYHQFVVKDRVLLRMLPGRSRPAAR